MTGIVDWFVGVIQQFIPWEISIVSADINMMVIWISAFNVLALSFATMAALLGAFGIIA